MTLDWYPVAVGQLVARDSNSEIRCRVTCRHGEGRWVAYASGVKIFEGHSLEAAMAKCAEETKSMVEKPKTIVYVAVSITRDHETEVVGVGATQEAAVTLVEEYRKEPLRLDEDNALNNYPAEGPPDCVGFALPFELK